MDFSVFFLYFGPFFVCIFSVFHLSSTERPVDRIPGIVTLESKGVDKRLCIICQDK